ncbi:hypothetical protein [Chitinophaga ginsengisoli]|uniref:Uncharacterized protein n=1 Tax=Chitinophaga ginsengisoli TaxID=363837 RepID=A0A2P8FQT8_9BACT|nr:hypothetical protein [Chitinophaga ginsengisoli]PSL24092.1 hypothetical protein CLV42_11678 [Chitinophaga ginsengisoli]
MAIKFTRKVEVINRVKAEGKFNYMNSGKDGEMRKAINTHVIETKRDFEHKERMSRIAASQLTLTA